MSGIGNLSDPSLRPSMDDAMDSGDDDAAHGDLDTMSDADIAALPAVRRVQYLRSLNAGATVGDDETLVLRILRASPADLVLVVDGADAWDLMYALDGSAATELRELLRARYYAQTAQLTALRLVRRCMDGETAEWEEEMVADIVVARSRPRRADHPDRCALPGMSAATTSTAGSTSSSGSSTATTRTACTRSWARTPPRRPRRAASGGELRRAAGA